MSEQKHIYDCGNVLIRGPELEIVYNLYKSRCKTMQELAQQTAIYYDFGVYLGIGQGEIVAHSGSEKV